MDGVGCSSWNSLVETAEESLPTTAAAEEETLEEMADVLAVEAAGLDDNEPDVRRPPPTAGLPPDVPEGDDDCVDWVDDDAAAGTVIW